MQPRNNMAIGRQLTSDNRSGICPEAWEALSNANACRSAPSYGEDQWTRKAADQLRELFEKDCEVYFVATGTAANSLGLASLCQSYHSIVCHEAAHIETDECGAPAFFSNGTKLLTAAGADGKLTPDVIDQIVHRRKDIHYPRPRVVSLTQSTELGTVYSIPEIAGICEKARASSLRVHMDGARFANAVAHLDCSLAEVTWKAGVDVLCFGGTKNGMMSGEAVIFFDRDAGAEFAYRCKQAGQLVSKMRFVSAQWVGMLRDGAWLRNARRANAMAQLLFQHLKSLTGIRVLYPVQSNAVFAQIPASTLKELAHLGWDLYTFIGGGTRLMCSWDTNASDIEQFVADFAAASTPARDTPSLKGLNSNRVVHPLDCIPAAQEPGVRPEADNFQLEIQ